MSKRQSRKPWIGDRGEDFTQDTNRISGWAVRIAETGSMPVSEVAQVGNLSELHEDGGGKETIVIL